MTKTALITGGSSGLGFELGRELGKQGYNVIILARNKERIDKAIQKYTAEGIVSTAYICDVTDEAGLRNVFDDVKKNYQKIDFLVLNAGMVTTKLLSEFTVEEMRTELDTDLWGIILSAHIFLPLLVSGSKILMISSGFGLMGAAGYSIYNAAKAGIINFGEAIRRELLPKNINVYVTAPGDMDTPQFQNEIKNQPEWMKTSTPRKCMPVDVAARNILKQCKGKRKFLIISGGDVKLLAIVSKLIPRKWKDALLDGMFPMPK